MQHTRNNNVKNKI